MDATMSGLNECLQKMPCNYDMLRDLLRMLQKEDFQAAFDLKDAFYLWPRAQVYCDCQGIQGPGSAPGTGTLQVPANGDGGFGRLAAGLGGGNQMRGECRGAGSNVQGSAVE